MILNPAEYGPATFAAVLVISSLGSLLPDIDSAGGDIWHTLPFGHTIGKISDPILAHRNITHSILGFALITYGFNLLLNLAPTYWGLNTHYILIALIAGYGSHLVADMITVEGIPLLWPIQKMFGIPPKPFDGVRIVTGKWFENLVIFPAVNLVLIILVASKWDVIKTILLK